MGILSGLLANYGDDIVRNAANHTDDALRIAAAQSDDLARTVANNADDIFYHGTPNGGFQQFHDGSYFTKNKAYADTYQNPLASDISFGKKADNPMTYQVKLHNKMPFDISDDTARKIYIDDYIKGGNATGINPYQPQSFYDNIKDIDWTEVEGLKDFLIDNGYGYDSIIANEGGYFDDLGNVVPRGQSVLMFNGKDVEIMPETQSTLKKLLSGNAADQIYPRVDDDYFNMFTNQQFRVPYETPEDLAKVAAFKNIIESGGEITPIAVRASGNGQYAIDDGLHRMRAFYETGRQPLFRVFDNKSDSYNFADLWNKSKGNPI